MQDSSPSISGPIGESSDLGDNYSQSGKNAAKDENEIIHDKIKELVDTINIKRKENSQLVIDFKADLDAFVAKSCDLLESKMFQLYDVNNPQIQDKLQELNEVMDTIESLQKEKEHFKRVLGAFYKDLATEN